MFPLKDDNPTKTKPIITIGIIIFCITIFLYQFSLIDTKNFEIINNFGMKPKDLLSSNSIPIYFTLFSSMFLHGGFMHLIGNMLFLWIYGNNIEDAMGHYKFLFFYIICGLAAAFLQAFVTPNSNIPMIGASGAVSGVLSAYLLLYPRARVHTLIFVFFFITVIRIPAGILIIIWLVIQIFNASLVDPNSPGVAWFAHIGGFVMGILLVPFFKKKDIRFFASGNKNYQNNKNIKLRFRK
ncbi:MAG: rhomboid family intramembrane serine protease [Rickettsiales bacterium]|nr:rhomboid family intramembrane serine protease [Rickettsiales bacterium]OUV79122.1 MAG: hypothetical protein CBC91_03960 [Rickettsiales bacterium TMED131]